MRKLVFVVSLAFIFACGETEEPNRSYSTAACSADCRGALAGVTTCDEYDGARFSGGTPTCNRSSCTVDTSACVDFCGGDCNGALAAGVQTCTDLDPVRYGSGALSCTSACTLDTTGCNEICGGDCNGQITNGSTTCADYDPARYGASTQSIACTQSCSVDTSNCVEICGGDCNGALAGITSCVQLNAMLYGGGMPTCTQACTIDTSSCTGPCTADCNGQIPGDALCVTYNSMQFLAGTLSCNMATCTVDTSGCTPISSNVRYEFEICSGNDCDTGLTCREGVTMGVNVCLTGCDSDATTDPCGANRECTAWSATAGDGICLPADASRDTACLLNYKLCAAAGGDCVTAGFDSFDDPVFRCKIECDQFDIGTAGSCVGGETCLASGVVTGVTPDQPCTNPGVVDTCTEGSCFSGWIDGQNRCANRLAFCGTVAPILGDFSQTAITNQINAGYTCDMIDDHRMCNVTGSDSMLDDAQAICTQLAVNDSLCVAICEDDVGAVLDCGASLDCCTPPSGEEIYFTIQQNGTANVPCSSPGTPGSCETGNNFSCIALGGGNYCAKPMMMCMTPGVFGAVCP